MMKKYFTDGLIQVAIVLSLLRTDLNNYFNSLADYANPDIETILGTSIAYTQTHFHRHRIEAHSYGYVHLKGADRIYAQYDTRHFEDLFSLTRDHHLFEGVGREVDAWLVSQSQPVEFASEGAVGNPSATGAEFPASEESGQRIASGAFAIEPILNEENDTSAADSVGLEDASGMELDELATDAFAAELTKEDMDLIDVLWRQDIDLGVGRDVFDSNLRKELEQERELELLKERHSQEANLDLKNEKEQIAVTYVLDNETGELVPVPNEDVEAQCRTRAAVLPPSCPEPQQVVEPVPLFNEDEQFSIGDTLSLFDDPVAPSTTTNSRVAMDFEFDNIIRDVTQQQIVAPPIDVQPQQLPQLQPYENMSLSRQSSMEQRWQDVASLLMAEVDPSPLGPLVNSSVDTTGSTRPVALLQNVSMTGVTDLSENDLTSAFGFASSFDLSPMTSANLATNASMGSFGDLASPSFLNMNTNDFVFANATTGNHSPASSSSPVWPEGGASSGGGSSVEMNNLFQNLVNSTLMDPFNLENMSASTSTDSTVPMMKMLEDATASSDSAISSFGDASPVPDYFDSQISDVYDGIEGATGGSSYHNSGSGEDSSSSVDNFGLKATMLHCESPTPSSNETTPNTTDHNSRRHVSHNHTYVTQPGDTPRQVKCYTTTSTTHKSTGTRKSRKSYAAAVAMEMSAERLVDCPVDEFTALLSSRKLNMEQTQLARDIRRRGKNKVAAQNCRERKMQAVDDLAVEVSELRALKRDLALKRAAMRDQLAVADAQLSRLHDSTLRALSYDPANYSLQQAENGDVFVVPRTGSMLAPPRSGGGSGKKAKRSKH